MTSKIIKELRSGHVRLTIWEHQDERGKRKSITLARLYKKLYLLSGSIACEAALTEKTMELL